VRDFRACPDQHQHADIKHGGDRCQKHVEERDGAEHQKGDAQSNEPSPFSPHFRNRCTQASRGMRDISHLAASNRLDPKANTPRIAWPNNSAKAKGRPFRATEAGKAPLREGASSTQL
jgi:hypothetical protein